MVGFWRQVADAVRPDGRHYEVAGIGGSWFRYGGDFQWSWQRDWFDLGNATAVFIEMMQADVLSEGMTKRMERSLSAEPPPARYPVFHGKVGLWERPT